MKISGNPGVSLNVSAVRELGSFLKNINPGDSVSASLIRSEGNKALLEIGGKTITAEFTSGVPGDKNIELVLTAKSPDKIQFSLKENGPADKLMRFLSPFSIMHEDDLKKSSLQNLARFINTSKPDLIEINLFLLGMKKDGQREKTGASFFNNLLLKGVTFQTLIDISYLIYSRYNPVLFMAYQYMLTLTGRKPFNSGKEDPLSFEDAMEHLGNILKEDDSDFSVMLDMIFDDYKNSEIYGDLIFPDDESFTGIEYILKDDSIFLRFDLSSAGELGVFVKSGKEFVLINFLSGKDEVLSFIKESEVLLKEMLEQNGIKKSVIGYFDSKKIVDKLELWSLDFYTKSEFNVKV